MLNALGQTLKIEYTTLTTFGHIHMCILYTHNIYSTRKAVVEVMMIAFTFTHEQEVMPPGEDKSQAAVAGAVTSGVRNTTRNHLQNLAVKRLPR